MFTFKVTPDDGDPFEVASTTRDILRWERTTKDASAHQLAEPSFGALYRIAHIAATRTGQFSGSLKEFEDAADLEIVGDDEPDPTQSGATAEA